MILISLTPYSPRRIFALVAALVGLASVSCFASDSLFLTVASTPYDSQMSRIQPVLYTKAKGETQVSLGVVNHWIQDLRSIPYGFSPQWKTPSEVATSPVADCKGKAVALYEKMREQGVQNVRLVIGKRAWNSRKTHAWIEWGTDGATYVLDPTINWSACRADRVGNHSYIPLYAYSGSRKYRAATTGTTLLARN